MIGLEANVAHYTFQCANLPPDVFAVARFSFTEGISTLWRCELDLLADDAYIDFDEVVNHRAAFLMKRGHEDVPIHGLVTELNQVGRTADYVRYRAVLAPCLWRLTLNYQNQIFQQKTVREILAEVLTEAGLTEEVDFAFVLKETYPPREYTVQYSERDIGFFHRLLEFDGIWYYFEQGEDREKLILTDDHNALPLVDDGLSIPYYDDAQMQAEYREHIGQFRCHQKMVPTGVRLNNYNYEMPDVSLLAESAVDEKKQGDYGVYYKYGEHYKTPEEGTRLARVRHEELACRRRVMTGQGTHVALRAGFVLTLGGHFRADYDGHYLLTQVTHRGSQWEAFALPPEDDWPTYTNAFSCIPASAPFRPERKTPKPQMLGVMMGRVDQGDEESYGDVDDHGRCRVRMDFELAEKGAMQGTLPVPECLPYTGSGYGMRFPHQKGVDAMWTCFNGDPDQPRIIGTQHNPAQASPVTSSNKWLNLIRTWGGHELKMVDEGGNKNVSLTTHDKHNLTMHDGEERVILISAGKNYDGRHYLTLDDANQLIELFSARGNQALFDDKNEKIAIQTTGGHLLIMEDQEEGGLGIGTGITLKTPEKYGVALSETLGYSAIATAENRFLFLSDDEERVLIGTNGFDTSNQHRLELNDGKQFILLSSELGHWFTIDDVNTIIGMGLTESHSIRMTDDAESTIIIETGASNGKITFDDFGDDALAVESKKKLRLSADQEITLEVGDNSIVLSTDGITISGKEIKITGDTVTSEATSGNQVLTGTPDVLINC